MSTDSILILYSSQTGTAKSIVELFISDDLATITTKCPELVKNPRLYDFTSYMKIDPDLSLLGKETKPVIFVIATTGQGDFPDNALPFMRIIRRIDKKFTPDSPRDSLPFVNVGMINLGLGDSNYDRFNGGIQQIERFLTKLGCTKHLATIHADDGIGLELGVEKWRKETVEFLKNYEDAPSAASPPGTTPNDNQPTPETTSVTPALQQTTTQPTRVEAPVFVTPQTFVAPPATAVKPEFLMKKHTAKVESVLALPSFLATQTQAHIAQNQKQIIDYIDHSNVISYNTLAPLSTHTTAATPTPLYTASTPTGGLLIGTQLLLQQYITGNNLHSFLLERFDANSPNAQAQRDLLTKLSEIEYGYSNINTIPLFAKVDTIGLPSQYSDQYPLVKTTIDTTLTLPNDTAKVIAKIPVCNESNPTTTIDTILPLQAGVPDQQQPTQPKIISLYRPGDSVSILCPNNYTDVQATLEFTETQQYAHHSLLLTTATQSNATSETTATDQTSPTPQTTNLPLIQTPLTHIHCNQPHQDFATMLINPNDGRKPIDFSQLVNLGGILFDIASGSAISNIPTLQSTLIHSFDLGAPIKKALLRCFADTCTPLKAELSDTTSAQYQRCVVELLYHLMSKAGIGKQTKSQIEGQGISLVDLLQLFTLPRDSTNDRLCAIRPDINNIIELCASLKPRSYSISSSPYKSLLLNQAATTSELNLDRPTDLVSLASILNTMATSPDHDEVEFIAGTQFRFVATLTTDELSPLVPLDGATYPGSGALPSSISSLCNQSYIDAVNNVDSNAKTLHGEHRLMTGKRYYQGLCTHLLLQINQDLIDLKASSPQTKNDFIAFMVTPAPSHSNPRFWGCVVKKETADYTNYDDLTINLPFFFHTSPTFHPPSLLTSRAEPTQHGSLPTNNNMMLFGPGTGASPFLSFIEQKLYHSILSTLITQPQISVGDQITRYCGLVLDRNGSGRSKINLFDNDAIRAAYNNHNITVSSTTSTLSLLLPPQPNAAQDHFGAITMFTGNRYRTQDYLHHQHWLDLLASTVHTAAPALNAIHSVFSREAEVASPEEAGLMSPVEPPLSPQSPRHVQDIITIQGEAVCKHILEGGFIYVCGDGVSMAKQVQKSIEAALVAHGDKYFNLFSLSHDLLIPDTIISQPDSNSNPTTFQCRYSDESVSKTLIDYITKSPSSFNTQFERESWAKGIVAVMMKGGRYNTDVW